MIAAGSSSCRITLARSTLGTSADNGWADGDAALGVLGVLLSRWLRYHKGQENPQKIPPKIHEIRITRAWDNHLGVSFASARL